MTAPGTGAAPEPAVVARGASVVRGGAEVLVGVDLTVAEGELVAVVGPNGAGKSTLVAALAGDLAPSAGEVRVLGRSASSEPPAALARLRAVVRQGARVPPGLSALELVRLGRLPHGDVDAPLGERIARRALELVGLGGLEARPAEQLSGGQAQGLHLARAVTQIGAPILDGAQARGVLLLDEPTTALDLSRQLSFLDLARRLARGGLAVVAVLHDLDLAARVADRILVLSGGRVVGCGPPREIISAELLARVFGVRATVVPAPWSPDRPWIGVEGLAAETSGAASGENMAR